MKWQAFCWKTIQSNQILKQIGLDSLLAKIWNKNEVWMQTEFLSNTNGLQNSGALNEQKAIGLA